MEMRRKLRIAYSSVALLGAIVFFSLGNNSVMAQQSSYLDQRQMDSNTDEIKSIEEKNKEQDDHFKYDDSQLKDHGEELTGIKWCGSIIMGTLGVLSILGYLPQKDKKA